MANEGVCFFCGTKVVLAHTGTGRPVQLDTDVTVYSVTKLGMDNQVVQTSLSFADHAEVCRKSQKPQEETHESTTRRR